jgi:hypothetical protein
MISLSVFLVLAAFATFRISDILVSERGPWDICFHLRRLVGIKHDGNMDPEIYPEKFLPLLFSCVGCMSVWVGAAVMFVYLCLPAIFSLLIVVPFGLSGAAVLIDSLQYKG